MNSTTPSPADRQHRFTREQAEAWGERHDIRLHGDDLMSAFEDAATLHLTLPADRQEAAGEARISPMPTKTHAANILQDAYEQTLGKPVTLPESLAAGEDGALPNVVSTAPEKVWLVIGEDCPSGVRFTDLFGVTWSEDKIDDNSIGYVREDLAARVQPAADSTGLAESLLAMIGRISTALGFSEEERSVANGDEEILDRLSGWKDALQFYAEQRHFAIADEDAWDTVSGEPQNFWCDEAGTATVEDGSVAKAALAGEPLDDEEDDTPAQPAATPPDAGVRQLTLHERDFLKTVLKNAGAKIRDLVSEEQLGLWTRFEEAGLIRCVGNWKWEPVDEDALIAALATQPNPPVHAAPVAWLKEWDSVGHTRTGLRRVDLTPECEPWLQNMCPTITPLYAKPTPPAEVERELVLGVCLDDDDTLHATIMRREPDGGATVLLSTFGQISRNRDFVFCGTPDTPIVESAEVEVAQAAPVDALPEDRQLLADVLSFMDDLTDSVRCTDRAQWIFERLRAAQAIVRATPRVEARPLTIPPGMWLAPMEPDEEMRRSLDTGPGRWVYTNVETYQRMRDSWLARQGIGTQPEADKGGEQWLK
jgi:hypothetical protein